MSTVILLLLIYALYFAFLTVISLQRNRIPNRDNFAEGLSVVVPFKNERRNLKAFLKQVEDSAYGRVSPEFIFVNDGSSDGSEDLIRSHPEFVLLKVPFDKGGKKEAIRMGVKAAKNKYIMTLDADVKLPFDFFQKLEAPFPNEDLLLFSLIPERRRGLVSAFFDLEFIALQVFGRFMAIKGKPILANGACLMFEKEMFLKVDSDRFDYHIPTGDDVFLLKAIEKARGSRSIGVARMGSSPRVGFPNTLAELIDQRARWISKTLDIDDFVYRSAAFAMAAIHLLIFPTSMLVIHYHGVFWGLIPLTLKISGEWMLFIRFLPEYSRKELLFFVPISQILYPAYIMIILFNGVAKRLKYKKRPVHVVEKI